MSRIPTEKQQEASRENGSKSHGPVTEEGKAKSARNASFEVMEQKFGIVCPNQDEEMGRILFGLMEDLSPDGLMQTLIVERIALFTWKIRRLERIEVQILTGELDPNPRIMTEEKRKVWEALQASYRRANAGKVKPPLSPDALYLRSFRDEEQLLDRIQSYVLKLTKAVDASLRELRRLKKSFATDEAPMDTDEKAADERRCTRIRGTGTPPVRKTETSDRKIENTQIEPENSGSAKTVGGAHPTAEDLRPQMRERQRPRAHGRGARATMAGSDGEKEIDQIEPDDVAATPVSVPIRAQSVATTHYPTRDRPTGDAHAQPAVPTGKST
jgi:hypothetical protein